MDIAPIIIGIAPTITIGDMYSINKTNFIFYFTK